MNFSSGDAGSIWFAFRCCGAPRSEIHRILAERSNDGRLRADQILWIEFEGRFALGLSPKLVLRLSGIKSSRVLLIGL